MRDILKTLHLIVRVVYGGHRVKVVVCKNRAEVLKIQKLKFFQTLPEHRYQWL